jgi:hypothetical protein
LLAVRIATAALAISHPTSGQQIYIGATFNIAGTGALTGGMPPNGVRIRAWKSPGVVDLPANIDVYKFPNADGTFDSGNVWYSGQPSDNGIITAVQNGNAPDATVTSIDWEQPPG